MIRFVPDAISEYTGPYPARVLNDAHVLGEGAVRAAPTVLIAFALPTNRPTTAPTAQSGAAGARRVMTPVAGLTVTLIVTGAAGLGPWMHVSTSASGSAPG